MATSTTPGSDAFISSLTSMVNREDTVAILQAQARMLGRFEKTNEMLSNFNKLSAGRYERTVEQFKDHTRVLMDMKRDLDVVFRKIRVLKDRLATEYPESFQAARMKVAQAEEEKEKEKEEEEAEEEKEKEEEEAEEEEEEAEKQGNSDTHDKKESVADKPT